MARVLITRPSPGLEQTAERLRIMGHSPVNAPLFVVKPIAWDAPDGPFDALMITSANALRHAGPLPESWRSLPCYAVGHATAEVARDHGLSHIITGPGHAAGLIAQMMNDRVQSVIHPTGREYTTIVPPHPPIHKVIVYAAEPVDDLADDARHALANGEIDRVLLYSARAARYFGQFADEAGLDRNKISIGAISAAVAEIAGHSWHDVAIAAQPSEDHLFAACGLVCD